MSRVPRRGRFRACQSAHAMAGPWSLLRARFWARHRRAVGAPPGSLLGTSSPAMGAPPGSLLGTSSPAMGAPPDRQFCQSVHALSSGGSRLDTLVKYLTLNVHLPPW